MAQRWGAAGGNELPSGRLQREDRETWNLPKEREILDGRFLWKKSLENNGKSCWEDHGRMIMEKSWDKNGITLG